MWTIFAQADSPVKAVGILKVFCVCPFSEKEWKNDLNREREILLLRKLVEQSGFFQRDPS